MKKAWIILVCAVILSGCSAKETWETVLDDGAVPVSAEARQVQLSIPQEAAVPTMESADGSKLFLCDGYTVMVQTLQGGDLNRTFREISGYNKDDLTVMHTVQNGKDRYEAVWCAAGEGEDQTCRAVILDDGVYHYAVTVMANYSQAGELSNIWQEILSSVTISTG